MTPRRIALYAVAGLLSAAAALAVAILLFGSFGETQGRILLTTLLIAFEGILALAPLTLLGQDRARPLAASSLALSTATVGLLLAFVWGAPLEGTGTKVLATIASLAAAALQATAVTARRGGSESATVSRLRAASHAFASLAAAGATVSVWAEISNTGWYRALGALVVVDVLSAGLQPVLARSAPADASARFRVTVTTAAGDFTSEVDARDAIQAIASVVAEQDREAILAARSERLG